MDTQEQLLTRIEAFIIRKNIAETTFGRRAVNDGKFVGRLRRGDNMTLTTMRRVDEYLSDPANAAETVRAQVA